MSRFLLKNKELKLKAEQNVLYYSMKKLIEQKMHPEDFNAGIEGENIETNQNRELLAQTLRQEEYNKHYENLKIKMP